VFNMSCLMGECVMWLNVLVGYVVFHVCVCIVGDGVLETLCLMGECVMWVSVCWICSVMDEYVG
jgi:hypothetical protein